MRASRNCAACLARPGALSNGRTAGFISRRAAGTRDAALATSPWKLEGLGAGAGTANCARRAAHLANSISPLARAAGETGLRWVDANAERACAAIHAVRNRRAPARIRRVAALRLGVHVRDLGDRRGFFAFCRKGRLPEARTLRIDSPSTIATRHASFCRRICRSRRIRLRRKFIEACAPLLEASGGRAFLLYTSYRGLAEGVRALQARFPEPPFPVLVQGEAPREALLNRFRELGNAVLLATGSFWEGVDVKGEALSIVAIDKLPFAAPDDPLLKARLEGIRGAAAILSSNISCRRRCWP
jgi:ATP-dependent DNA helicase DinG